MKFAFKATTTIAILSLALFVSAPTVFAALSGVIFINPPSVVAPNPYSVSVNLTGETPNQTIQVSIWESKSGGTPTNVYTSICNSGTFNRCEVVKAFNNSVVGTYTYYAVLDITSEKVTTASKSIVVSATSDGTGSGGTTPTGGPLKGENLPSTGAPTLFGLTTGGAELLKTIDDIGNWVFVFLIAVAAIFLIVSGFMYITAAGSTENITKAKQMLINALIGVVIALLARGMVQVIRTILGG